VRQDTGRVPLLLHFDGCGAKRIHLRGPRGATPNIEGRVGLGEGLDDARTTVVTVGVHSATRTI
jgi:hypothetical protein